MRTRPPKKVILITDHLAQIEHLTAHLGAEATRLLLICRETSAAMHAERQAWVDLAAKVDAPATPIEKDEH